MLRSLLLLVLALLAPGCLAPPAVVANIRPIPKEPLASFPPDTRAITIPIEGGAELHGLFVPSDPGAPVVLHLLEAGASAADLPGHQLLVEELADLGYASLLVDYEGVGLSPGERDVDHLERDARAAWSAAVQLAGDSERVVLRGTSIGTLAVGTLLHEGAHPMAVVLVAPVRADTVVPRAAAVLYSFVASWFAELAFRRVAPVDLTAELARVRAPLLVAGSHADEFVGAEHVARFERSVRAAGGRWFESKGTTHILLAAQSLRSLAEERELLRSLHAPTVEPRRTELLASLSDELHARLPEGSGERARFEELSRRVRPGHPALDVAAVLCSRDATEAARRRRYLLGSKHDGNLDALSALLDLEDRAGPISFAKLEELLVSFSPIQSTLGSDLPFDVDQLLAAACMEKLHFEFHVLQADKTLDLEFTLPMKAFEGACAEPGMSPPTVRRRAFRLLCKVLAIPERPLASSDTTFEVFQHGRWIEKHYPSAMLDTPATRN
ncbi:MAG: alpha/beta hydrolase [Planctomycetes bacterium]|nr:alpha/beta hydrolase [Planctomycetota bacterium]